MTRAAGLPEWVATQRALAEIFGTTQQTIGRWVKLGAPDKQPRGYHVPTWRKWTAKNKKHTNLQHGEGRRSASKAALKLPPSDLPVTVKGDSPPAVRLAGESLPAEGKGRRSARKAASTPPPTDHTEPPPPGPDADAEVRALREATAGHLRTLVAASSGHEQIAEAMVRVAAAQLEAELREGRFDARTLQSVKGSLEELRKARDAYLCLREREGKLIERSVAVSVITQIGLRVRDIRSRLKRLVANQVEAWVTSTDFRAADNDTRRRAVSQWFDAATDRLQAADAAEVDGMIAGVIDE